MQASDEHLFAGRDHRGARRFPPALGVLEHHLYNHNHNDGDGDGDDDVEHYGDVDDLLDAYGDGFESSSDEGRVNQHQQQQHEHEHEHEHPHEHQHQHEHEQSPRPTSQPEPEPQQHQSQKLAHRRSQSASVLIVGVPRLNNNHQNDIPTAPSLENNPPKYIARDRYGFKKASHYITVDAYDAWNAQYTPHLERRSKKWHLLMRSYGLNTSPGAVRFPPKSDKIKRYVRKGIPPEFRGNAWFWYAGGPAKLAQNPGLYQSLLHKVESGGLRETDREHIERDLQRTFPDNISFKADVVVDGTAQNNKSTVLRDSGTTMASLAMSTSESGNSIQPPLPVRDSSNSAIPSFPARDSSNSLGMTGIPSRLGPPTRDSSTPPITIQGQETPPPSIHDANNVRSSTATTSTTTSKFRSRLPKDTPPETPIIHSLRRVLQAFAIHNPQIGYCQSLNFIAGLLLLFLDSDEEKSFILLSIVTEQHLPGTHGVALEGANIDIGVLMSCIKDYLPAVWARLDDNEGGQRLPTVSLATTAWFMSLFVGTLPIESVLRVWDCLFFEGSKTLFRVAMSIFKTCEDQVVELGDPMEVFQLVQSFPRGMLDANGLMEQCFRRRTGFGGISQGLIEGRRRARREAVKEGNRIGGDVGTGNAFGKLRGRLRSTRRVGRRIETD